MILRKGEKEKKSRRAWGALRLESSQNQLAWRLYFYVLQYFLGTSHLHCLGGIPWESLLPRNCRPQGLSPQVMLGLPGRVLFRWHHWLYCSPLVPLCTALAPLAFLLFSNIPSSFSPRIFCTCYSLYLDSSIPPQLHILLPHLTQPSLITQLKMSISPFFLLLCV